jgi:hypothetical protein
MPPAFNLSQDQTLQLIIHRSPLRRTTDLLKVALGEPIRRSEPVGLSSGPTPDAGRRLNLPVILEHHCR